MLLEWILQQTTKQQQVAAISEKHHFSPYTGQVLNI